MKRLFAGMGWQDASIVVLIGVWFYPVLFLATGNPVPGIFKVLAALGTVGVAWALLQRHVWLPAKERRFLDDLKTGIKRKGGGAC